MTDESTPDQLRKKAADLLKAAHAVPLRPLWLTYEDSNANRRGPGKRRAAARSGVPETESFFSVAEAAAELRLSEQTVYGLCQRRKIRHERHGLGRGKILIPADALDEYRRRCTVDVLEEPTKARTRQPVKLKHLSLD
jgi:excisionase family DNA binding protein